MRYKYSLSLKLRGYVEWQLEHYHDDKKQLEQCRRELLPSATQSISETAGCSIGEVSSQTERYAIKRMTNPYMLSLERSVNAVERVLSRLDDTDKRLIELVYWRRTHTIVGAAYRTNLSKSSAYRRINNILTAVAVEMGIVSP